MRKYSRYHLTKEAKFNQKMLKRVKELIIQTRDKIKDKEISLSNLELHEIHYDLLEQNFIDHVNSDREKLKLEIKEDRNYLDKLEDLYDNFERAFIWEVQQSGSF